MRKRRNNMGNKYFTNHGYTEATVTIKAGETVSSELDFRGFEKLAFVMPAAWTSATLTIKASVDEGGTKLPLKNDEGISFPAMAVAVDTIYCVDIHSMMLSVMPYLAFESSSAQSADRVIKILMKG